ncbi:MAG: hypothetical protein LQ337_007074 [Flavoplaca oasis]|nr:MAG: hypothetical protein LQ337_007074 [Flavoplaca oasis]
MEGSINRINLWEVQFADPEFYDVLYSSKSRYSKIDRLKYRFGTPSASFKTTDHALHAHRRGAMNPFSSQLRILRYAPYAAARVERLYQRLEREYKGTAKLFCFNDACASLPTDVINYYSFAISYDFQDYPDFVTLFTKSIKFRGGHPESGHGTSIRIPERSCPLFRFTGFRLAIVPLGITAQFKRIVHEESTGDNNAAADHKTVFSELLKSDLSQQELSLDRLKHEALSIIGGEVVGADGGKDCADDEEGLEVADFVDKNATDHNADARGKD